MPESTMNKGILLTSPHSSFCSDAHGSLHRSPTSIAQCGEVPRSLCSSSHYPDPSPTSKSNCPTCKSVKTKIEPSTQVSMEINQIRHRRYRASAWQEKNHYFNLCFVIVVIIDIIHLSWRKSSRLIYLCMPHWVRSSTADRLFLFCFVLIE